MTTQVYEPGKPIKRTVSYTKEEREWLEAKRRENERIDKPGNYKKRNV